MVIGCGDTRRNNGISTTVCGIRYGTLEEGGREGGGRDAVNTHVQ